MTRRASKPQRNLDRYLEIQTANLAEVRTLPEFTLAERVIDLYEYSITVVPRDPDVRFMQLFIICHTALLSGAATIGRALPADALAITRRAIEAASLAAAIKTDPGNYEKWVDGERRLRRWEQRQQGIQPKEQPGGGIKYPENVKRLRGYLGILSDAGTHLTPELIATQGFRVEPIDGGPQARITYPYFQSSQRELERSLMFLVAVHLDILEAFNEVFADAFHRDGEWTRRRQDIGALGATLAHRFRAEAEGTHAGDDEP